MKNLRSMAYRALPVCVRFIQVGLGCMFLCSALPKIRQPYGFLSNVYQYQLGGPTFGLIVAIILPWLELGIGICLVGGVLVAGSLLISFSLTIAFAIAVGSALHRGLNISCGCFGSSATDAISLFTLIRVFSIMVLSILAYFGTIRAQAQAPQERASNLIGTRELPPVRPSLNDVRSLA